MTESNVNTSRSSSEDTAAAAWNDIAGIPTTPVAPPGGTPAYDGDDSANIPTTPIAPEGGRPVYPGPSVNWPNFRPDFPIFPMPNPGNSPVIYYSQVRFLNATTGNRNLDVLIDGQNVFSGSDFATVSNYVSISDGFHTVTVRRSNGPILFQQTVAFISGEKVTMVLLDQANGITISKVSDMGCTNVPAGYGCIRVANMSYNGSSYDIRLFNNQVLFGGVGYKEVTSLKQASSGNYTFFVTNSQINITSFNELPVLILSAIVGGNCSGCAINNPLLTYSINVKPGRVYTSYIIGNPWSNKYQVYTLED